MRSLSVLALVVFSAIYPCTSPAQTARKPSASAKPKTVSQAAASPRSAPTVRTAPAPTPAVSPATAASAASRAQSLGAVRPSNLVLMQLGVSSFEGAPEAAQIAQVVQNDLLLADIAMRPTNQAGAAAAAQKDKQAGAVNLDGWAAAGVNYVMKGAVVGGALQVELYDVASKARVIGQNYGGYSSAQARRFAHRAADDVMTAIGNMPGVFSSQICYLSERGRNKEVMVMDADGGAARQITNEGSIVASPCWGRNGTEIYYTSYRDNNPDLYGISLNGRRFEVSRRPGLNTSPSWSEAKGRLAVTLAKDGNTEIYSMSPDGRDLARLTNSPDADTAPEWSPDGTRIAFTSDRDGRPQIYIMNSGGGGAQRITGGGYCDSPSWSPDGRRIAYVAREGGEFNLYMVDVAGGGPAVQLTRGMRDNLDPSWGASSKHLVFSSNRGGSREIYMMNVDTKQAKPVTRSGGAGSPAWGPVKK